MGADTEDPLDGLVLLTSSKSGIYYVGMGYEGRAFVLLYEEIGLTEDEVNDLHEDWWRPYRDKLVTALRGALTLLHSAKGTTAYARSSVDLCCAVWLIPEEETGPAPGGRLVRIFNETRLTDDLREVVSEVNIMLQPFFEQRLQLDLAETGAQVTYDA